MQETPIKYTTMNPIIFNKNMVFREWIFKALEMIGFEKLIKKTLK